MASPGDVTQLLSRMRSGDRSVMDQLALLLYQELRRLAGGFLRRERPDHTLQPTALVHEAYLRMAGGDTSDWQSRAHFLGIAARVMRQILVDHARKHSAQKRGSGARVELQEELVASTERLSDLEELDRALVQLAQLDARKAQAIEMRYFGGMTAEEIAESLGVSQPTVKRDLRMAQSWLSHILSGGTASASAGK
jgi:RNA polymerase sigma factor (TIGR02999 family)